MAKLLPRWPCWFTNGRRDGKCNGFAEIPVLVGDKVLLRVCVPCGAEFQHLIDTTHVCGLWCPLHGGHS